MKDWYTRQEVADLLGVSKGTVYNYAKQKKIVKIIDPHQNIRGARYRKEEVDVLVSERKSQEISGIRPSELAMELNIPTYRIYQLINDNDIPVHQVRIGDEKVEYSISDDLAERIKKLAAESLPPRGTRTEFYSSESDIALYQKFVASNGESLRVVRNEFWEWGFYLPDNRWLPYHTGKSRYIPAYSIHHKNMTIKGYTDFKLSKDRFETYDFLDFIYPTWGIENIRLREHEDYFALSIKSGSVSLSVPVPESLTSEVINSFTILGSVIRNDESWELISGYRKVMLNLPVNIIEEIRKKGAANKASISDTIENLLIERFGEDED